MEEGGESYQHMNTLTIVVLIYYCCYHSDRYLIKMFVLLQNVAITMVMTTLIGIHTTFVYLTGECVGYCVYEDQQSLPLPLPWKWLTLLAILGPLHVLDVPSSDG